MKFIINQVKYEKISRYDSYDFRDSIPDNLLNRFIVNCFWKRRFNNRPPSLNNTGEGDAIVIYNKIFTYEKKTYYHMNKWFHENKKNSTYNSKLYYICA